MLMPFLLFDINGICKEERTSFFFNQRCDLT